MAKVFIILIHLIYLIHAWMFSLKISQEACTTTQSIHHSVSCSRFMHDEIVKPLQICCPSCKHAINMLLISKMLQGLMVTVNNELFRQQIDFPSFQSSENS